MSDKTLGQIAYEEWAEIVHPAGKIPWDRVGMQVGWENIAQAVVQEEARRFEELVLNPPPLKPADKAVLDEIGPTPFRDLRNLRKEQRQHQAEIERLREALDKAKRYVRTHCELCGLDYTETFVWKEIDAALQKPVDKADKVG